MISDVIHNDITITPDMLKIIDTPIFQRLARVKQLTSTEFVFPNANHTRKEHSLGAMHLASKYATVLQLSLYDTRLVKLAGLLHDIAHGSFSHTWDSIVYSGIYPGKHKGHDEHRHKVISLLKDELNDISICMSDITRVWNNTYSNDKVLAAIIGGPVSVDRGDFIQRDSYYTGIKCSFDMKRIIRHSSVYIKNEIKLLAYDESVIPDIIQGLNNRLYMYNRVFLHRTVIAAAILIEAMIEKAKDYLKLVERTQNLNKFIYLNDSILDEIINNEAPELDEARYYAKRIYNRELPKLVSEEIIYLKDLSETNHYEPGIKIQDDKIIWVSRVLSNDFCSEFDEYDIHVRTRNGYVPFRKYWEENKYVQRIAIQTYYIKRVYSL